MATDAITSDTNDYPRTQYTQTLLWIGAAEVVFFWGFLVLVGLFPRQAITSFAPISSIFGFIIVGLAILEFGVVVLNVQLAWLLPDDHDESGVAPFLCGYCLLAQSLLMFPPLVMVAVVVVPLLLISLASVGWYFQKFTSLKLAKHGSVAMQSPLSLRALLWMPICLLGLGIIPIMLSLFCGPYYFELAITNWKHLGFVVICSAMGMMSVSFLPLAICYAFLYLDRCSRSAKILTTAIVILIFGSGIAIEATLSNFSSPIMPLALIAVVMFVAGVWSGLKPWQLDGLRVVIAKPIYRPDVADVKFDDLN
jgi:hypothetical protein